MGLQQKINNPGLTFWQLGIILGTALGLPAMIVGGQVAKEYGGGTALISVCVGNLILWMIGLGIISMSGKETNSVENVQWYLGKLSGKIAAFIIVSAFLLWYAAQIQGAAVVFNFFIQEHKTIGKDFAIRLSTAFGLFCALLSIGGIRLLKWICVVSFPLLLAFQIYALTQLDKFTHFQGTWGVSFSATLLIIATWLPGIVNLPTFFRHSRSKADSYLALSLMSVIHILFEGFTVITSIDRPLAIFSGHIAETNLYVIAVVIFVFFAFICINLVNIYFASAGWEAIFPQRHSYKEYAIIGLFGTVIYTVFQRSLYIEYAKTAGTNFIASLGIVLVMSFLVKIFVKHRPRPIEKLCNSICWIIGCLSSIFAQIYGAPEASYSLWVGINSSFMSFLIFIFIEEVVWSLGKLRRNNRS